MRLALFALLLCAAACEREQAAGQTRSGTARVDDSAREQARFDKERNPAKVVEALKIGPGSRVADVGAGSGLLTLHLARAVAPNGRVVATDIDGQVLDLLHQRLQAAHLDDIVERRIVDPDQPQLEAGLYDAILLAEVDHHFKDPIAWLKAALPALKPTGRIVISNRIYHRATSMAAAQKAGLLIENESTPVPSHFIAVFVPPRSK
ncbi:MAG TPA: methyltransferase [Kofleriaceae bacterium]|nr:methyltransferase [Kofleriaceae bacterium]